MAVNKSDPIDNTLDTRKTTRTISMPEFWWQTVESIAKHDGVTVSQWVRNMLQPTLVEYWNHAKRSPKQR